MPPARRSRGNECGCRGPRRPSVRRHDHRGHRPQHGGGRLREVLQDRRAVGDGHETVRRGRRWLRDGGGCCTVRPQTAGGRRARRRPDLLRDSRHRRFQRRQGQGHHRPESDRSTLGGAPSLGDRGRRPGHGQRDRSPRHIDSESATPPNSRASPTCSVPLAHARDRRARVGQVEHRPPQGRGGGCGHVQDGAQLARQGAGAQPALRRSEPQCGLGHVSVRRQHRAARVGDTAVGCSARRRQCLRVRWHELPRGARRARAGTTQASAARVRGCRRRPCLGRRACIGLGPGNGGVSC